MSDQLSCSGKTCTCGEGRRFAQHRGGGILSGLCESCGGTFIECDATLLAPPQLTEQDVRRIVREELTDLARRAVNRVARQLPHA